MQGRRAISNLPELRSQAVGSSYRRAAEARRLQHVILERYRVTMKWRAIPGFPYHQISNTGLAKWSAGLKAGGIVRPIINKGYATYWLKRYDGKFVAIRANRAVLMAFVGPPPSPEYDAAHRNGKRLDNRLRNLKWSTRLDNVRDAYRHGTGVRGERCARAKLTASQIKAIRVERREGRFLKDIAKRFGVHFSNIQQICSRQTWKHVRGF